MGKIKGWEKIQDRKNTIAWKSSDGERVSVHKMTDDHWMMGADGMLHVKKFTNKKESLESAVKYMKKSNPIPN